MALDCPRRYNCCHYDLCYEGLSSLINRVCFGFSMVIAGRHFSLDNSCSSMVCVFGVVDFINSDFGPFCDECSLGFGLLDTLRLNLSWVENAGYSKFRFLHKEISVELCFLHEVQNTLVGLATNYSIKILTWFPARLLNYSR
jgi:hypothetical protein